MSIQYRSQWRQTAPIKKLLQLKRTLENCSDLNNVFFAEFLNTNRADYLNASQELRILSRIIETRIRSDVNAKNEVSNAN